MKQIFRLLSLLFIFLHGLVSFTVSDISTNGHEQQVQPAINSIENSVYFLLTKIDRKPSKRTSNVDQNVLIHSELQINCPNTREQCFDDLENDAVKVFTANLCLVAATQSENLNCRFLKLSRSPNKTLSFDVVEEKLYDIIKNENTSSLVTQENKSLELQTGSLNLNNKEFYPFSKNGTVSYHAIRFSLRKPQSYVFFKINENEEFVLSYIYVDPVYEKFDDIRRTHLCNDPTENRIDRFLHRKNDIGHSIANLFNQYPYAGIPLSLNKTYPGIIPANVPFSSRFHVTECFKEPLIPMLLNSTKTKLETESIVHYYFHKISLDFCSLFLCSADFCINVRDIFKYVRSVPSQISRSLQEKNDASNSILAKRLHLSGDLLKKKLNNLKQLPSSNAEPISLNVSETLKNSTEKNQLSTGDWRSVQSIKLTTEEKEKLAKDSKIVTVSQETVPNANLEKLSQEELLDTTNKGRRFQHKKIHFNRSKHLPLNKRLVTKYSFNDFKEIVNQKLNKWKNNTLELGNDTLSPVMTLSDKLKKSLQQKKKAESNASKVSRFSNRFNPIETEEGKENPHVERPSTKTPTDDEMQENRYTLLHRKKLNHLNSKIHGIHARNRTEHSHH